jgi:hypothetical protein
MKKIYFYMMAALVALTMASCSNWESPYYVEDIVGSWVSEYGCDGYGEYDILGYDVVRYDFYSNYTGRYTYYSYYGLDYVDFDWETRGDRLNIRYYDGDYESLYYGFDRYGYLLLSLDRYFYQYTAYSPGGRYYEPAKGMAKAPAESTGDLVTKRDSTVKIKSLSRGVKARAEE